MNTRRSLLLTTSLLALTAPAVAQDFDPSPAEELARFEPMIGNWSGTGSMEMPGVGKRTWKAHGSYRWCMNKHWVQEDFTVSMEGDPTPLMFRSYIGWDRENERYVAAVASNEGACQFSEVTMLPDGTMLQMLVHHADGAPYTERARTKVDGDKMSMQIDMMTLEGPSMQMIDGELARTDAAFEGDLDGKAWMGAQPHADVTKLARMAGTYETAGEMVMMPGQPMMKISGTDVFRPIFGGTVVHGHTTGAAEGVPQTYESHGFWAWNAHNKCVDLVFVDNMGQCGAMQGWWMGDKFVSTSAAVMMGQPTTQRFVVAVDGAGHVVSGVGHTTMGTMDPFLSFRGKYTRK